jgi:translation elongation factor EF-G
LPVWSSRSWRQAPRPVVVRAHLQRHDQGWFYAYNPIKGSKERVGRLMRMHANKREDIEDASAARSSPSAV